MFDERKIKEKLVADDIFSFLLYYVRWFLLLHICKAIASVYYSLIHREILFFITDAFILFTEVSFFLFF